MWLSPLSVSGKVLPRRREALGNLLPPGAESLFSIRSSLNLVLSHKVMDDPVQVHLFLPQVLTCHQLIVTLVGPLAFSQAFSVEALEEGAAGEATPGSGHGAAVPFKVAGQSLIHGVVTANKRAVSPAACRSRVCLAQAARRPRHRDAWCR